MAKIKKRIWRPSLHENSVAIQRDGNMFAVNCLNDTEADLVVGAILRSMKRYREAARRKIVTRTMKAYGEEAQRKFVTALRIPRTVRHVRGPRTWAIEIVLKPRSEMSAAPSHQDFGGAAYRLYLETTGEKEKDERQLEDLCASLKTAVTTL